MKLRSNRAQTAHSANSRTRSIWPLASRGMASLALMRAASLRKAAPAVSCAIPRVFAVVPAFVARASTTALTAKPGDVGKATKALIQCLAEEVKHEEADKSAQEALAATSFGDFKLDGERWWWWWWGGGGCVHAALLHVEPFPHSPRPPPLLPPARPTLWWAQRPRARRASC
jgi:hypothetical protein